MAVGEALAIHERTGRRVRIGRSPDRPASSIMFRGLDFLDQGGGACKEFVRSFEGGRPYIDYGRSRRGQRLHANYRAKAGRIAFTKDERERAAELVAGVDPPRVFVEPHVKGSFSGDNKRWPWSHWMRVAWALHDAGRSVVQVSAPRFQSTLPHTLRVAVDDVRVALATLEHAAVLVTTDGLLHHAAAALDVPTVVIWGARTDPRILGYPYQVNLTSGTDWCGSRAPCDHCREAMQRIEPERVLDAVEGLL